MSRNKSDKSNKSKNRVYLQFFGVILIAGLIGGFSGFTASMFEKNLAETASLLGKWVRDCSPYLVIAVGIAGSIVNGFLVWKAKKDIRNWDQEDEEEAGRIERDNIRSQGILSVLVIFNMLLGMISVSGKPGRDDINVIYMISMLCFTVYSLWCAFAVNSLVECMKKMNPEKRGNALSIHFDKEWLKSCDEREKARMYRAAYTVYARSQYLYAGLFIFFIVISAGVDIGVLPFIVVGFIWIVQNITYNRSYEKNEKGRAA